MPNSPKRNNQASINASFAMTKDTLQKYSLNPERPIRKLKRQRKPWLLSFQLNMKLFMIFIQIHKEFPNLILTLKEEY